MKIIKTSEALPKSGRYVLAWLEGAKIPMRAMWAAQHTLPLGDDADPEWGEYSEEKDEYFCPAGWYEMNQHEEQHWGVDGNVVAWCELPRLDHQCLAQIEEPAGAAPAAVAPQGEWRIDTSTGRGILVYKNCSVIEAEQAPYVLGSIAADAAAAHAPAAPAVDALDAARLDWLEQQAKQSPTGISFDYVLHAEDGQVLEKGWRFMRRHFLGERKSNLRAAIDAAQAQQKGSAS